MSSEDQLLCNQPISYDLFQEIDPEESVAGETKSYLKNDSSDPDQRKLVAYRRSKSSYIVSVEMVLCVHGWENPEKTQPMSLMVFDYQIHYNQRGHRVASVRTEFNFTETKQNEAGDRARPQVRAYAPFELETRWNETEAEVRKQIHGDVNIGVDNVAKVEVNPGVEREVQHKQKYFDKGTACKLFDEKTQDLNGVQWYLEQNDRQDQGVSSNFSVAILVARSSHAKFEGRFLIRLEAGPGEDLKAGIQRFFSRAEDAPVILNPQRAPEGSKWAQYADKINMDHLGQLAEHDQLTKLVEAWGVDLGSFTPS